MNGLPSIKRRLEKIEETRPKPDQMVYQFIAWEHDPCLDIDPPWDNPNSINIIEIIVSPGRQPVPESERGNSSCIQYYGDALRDWEKGIKPLTAQEWRAGHGP